MAGGETEDNVGGSSVGRGPADLLDGDDLPLAIGGILCRFTFYQVHIRLVKILSGNISVMDFYPMAVLPFFYFLVITFVGCADAFGKQIPCLLYTSPSPRDTR